MENKGYIYKITNTENDKIYIGQTINDINKRFNQHIYSARHGHASHLYNGMRKYGVDKFSISLVEEVEPKDISESEMRYIAKYDTINNGYNIGLGGENIWNRGLTKDTNEKLKEISESRKGKGNPMYGRTYEHTEETKQKISEANSGESNGMYGRTYEHTEETKQKISEANSGESNGMYGKKYTMSDNRKKNISKAKKEKYDKRKTSHITKGDFFYEGTCQKIKCYCSECGNRKIVNKHYLNKSKGRLICECQKR